LGDLGALWAGLSRGLEVAHVAPKRPQIANARSAPCTSWGALSAVPYGAH